MCEFPRQLLQQTVCAPPPGVVFLRFERCLRCGGSTSKHVAQYTRGNRKGALMFEEEPGGLGSNQWGKRGVSVRQQKKLAKRHARNQKRQEKLRASTPDLANVNNEDVDSDKLAQKIIVLLQGGDPFGELSGADFSGENLQGANFEGANLQGANFAGTNLVDVDFRGANLQGANFEGANLHKAKLQPRYAKDDESWRDTLTNVREANFKNADLSEANFLGADTDNCIFYGANPQRAHLRTINFNGIDCRKANFKGAFIDSRPLRRHFRGTGKNKIDLTGAIVQNRQLPVVPKSNIFYFFVRPHTKQMLYEDTVQ